MSLEEYRKAIKPRKYNNVHTVVDNITFDSQDEARRYQELKLLLKAKLIRDLKIHPRFKLTKSISYEADFQYEDIERKLPVVIEDVKGHKTALYKLKWQRLQEMYPTYTFIEIEY